ncbi:MAG: carbohydrate kinase [Cyclobacteriaceae bacterium]
MVALSFGEILFDIIDGKPYLGGAPLNISGHLTQLGLPTSIISAVGNDRLGHLALERIKALGISASFIKVLDNQPTGTVDVFLRDGLPDYTIHENVAWDAIHFDAITDAESIKNCDLFCFGSLSQRTANNRQMLFGIIQQLRPKCVFYDVNLRSRFFNTEIVLGSMTVADIVKFNDEEAVFLSQLIYQKSMTDAEFAENLQKDYNVKIVIITSGANGAHAFSNGSSYFAASERIIVNDTIGAGDSFSAAFLYTYLHGKNIEHALQAGNSLGAYVATQRGAIPAYRAELTNQIQALAGLD